MLDQSASDNEGLQAYAAKRKLWLDILSGEDRHSIRNQLSRLIWDAASFRVINEARRYAEQDDKGNPKLSGTVHDIINRGFFEMQASGIRRLLDKETRTGKREVFSLWRVLDDMEKNALLMTRENIFAAEGLPYDYEPIREARFDYLRERRNAGQLASYMPRALDYHTPEMRHETIDRLAGVSEDARTPTDNVRMKILATLKEKLKPCEPIVTYVHKFIAHPAAPGSRAIVNADKIEIPLMKLWDAHERICRVAGFITIRLLGSSFPPPLPHPQFNQFQYMDFPLVKTENIPKLGDTWQEYRRETENWDPWELDEFEEEMRNCGT